MTHLVNTRLSRIFHMVKMLCKWTQRMNRCSITGHRARTISCLRNCILLSSLFKSPEFARNLQLPRCGAAGFSWCFPPARERMRLSGTLRPNFVSMSFKSGNTLLSSSIVDLSGGITQPRCVVWNRRKRTITAPRLVDGVGGVGETRAQEPRPKRSWFKVARPPRNLTHAAPTIKCGTRKLFTSGLRQQTSHWRVWTSETRCALTAAPHWSLPQGSFLWNQTPHRWGVVKQKKAHGGIQFSGDTHTPEARVSTSGCLCMSVSGRTKKKKETPMCVLHEWW